VSIRAATPEDWQRIWPFFRETVLAAAPTLLWPLCGVAGLTAAATVLGSRRLVGSPTAGPAA
jgi:hypothetical protein